MIQDNIQLGRDRAYEILNIINPKDAEVFYGEDNGGIGYCPFKYINNDGNEIAVTVRTSKDDYIKLDKRMLLTNIDRCNLYSMKHVLILGFNWISNQNQPNIYAINTEMIKHVLSHTTPKRKYLVFKEEQLKRGWLHGITKLL